MLGFFESHLWKLYPHKEVCNWFARNVDQLSQELIKFAKYLCDNDVQQLYNILQMTRICEGYRDY